MKSTKYLFDEGKMTPEGMVSVSQIQTFLSCKKKWEYDYVECIRPRVERPYLTIGKLCHKGMQKIMQDLWTCNHYDWKPNYADIKDNGLFAIEKEWKEYMDTTDLLNEELPDFEQLLVDAKSVFTQAYYEFEPWKYEVVTLCKKGKPIPALELHFRVPCPPTRGLHGFIDAILKDKETGFTWCVDYKFRKSLSPDEEEAFNIQNAVYAYACNKMGVDITGTMTWQHINTPTANPAILKDGRISRAKIKTTWDKYSAFCVEHGEDPNDYAEEMQNKLADIEWFRATLEYRNEDTIDRIWRDCVVPAVKQIKQAHSKSVNNYRSMYPWNCKMCQYQSLCQAELRDYDSKAIREREYTVRDISRTHGSASSLASDSSDE